MKLLLLLLSSIFLVTAFASPEHAPPSFSYKNGKAVFVDFTHSKHEITYNFLKKTVSVESIMTFSANEKGYAVFDLVEAPTEMILDGGATSAELVSLDQETSVRVVNKMVNVGDHELRVKHSFSANVVFSAQGVASGFWFSDLNDRQYLELYLPSNLEFDQYPKQFYVNFDGFGDIVHVVKANGLVTKLSEQRFEINFPDFYTSSSIYFHVFPETANFLKEQFNYTSVDGRLIPIDLYTSVDIKPFVELTPKLLRELENDYGPFPHDQVIIYGNSLMKGGMEYAGATVTGLQSLGHELFHSYNARGILPANGNSGWMDEAMARWRDYGYPLVLNIPDQPGRLAGHSIWARRTDRNSYTEGSAFLAKIASRMNASGLSLKTFLRNYFQSYMYSTVTTQTFEAKMNEFAGINFSPLFDRYIYGKSSALKKRMSINFPDLHHPQWTKDELLLMTMPK